LGVLSINSPFALGLIDRVLRKRHIFGCSAFSDNGDILTNEFSTYLALTVSDSLARSRLYLQGLVHRPI